MKDAGKRLLGFGTSWTLCFPNCIMGFEFKGNVYSQSLWKMLYYSLDFAIWLPTNIFSIFGTKDHGRNQQTH